MEKVRSFYAGKGAGPTGRPGLPLVGGLGILPPGWALPAAGIVLLVLAGCKGQPAAQRAPAPGPPDETATMPLSITSMAFANNARIPQKYTCDGSDVSPTLSWSKPPQGTVQVALICDDPDAPRGGWVHWVLYGLPADKQLLPEALPALPTLLDFEGARQGRNDFGKTGYGGPCPPKGPAHHYHFRVYALDAKIELQGGATAGELKRAMEGHILAQAEIVGLYSR